MIKRLICIDFDKCLFQTPESEEGKLIYQEKTGQQYPYLGWWSKPESLDMNVFDIKPYPSMLKQFNLEQSKPNTHIIILTNRREFLRPQVQAILDANNIQADELVMANDQRTKGEKILDYINEFPDLEEICVYDDQEDQIQTYVNISSKIPKNILFNIYRVNNDKISLMERENKLISIINEEILKISIYNKI